MAQGDTLRQVIFADQEGFGGHLRRLANDYIETADHSSTQKRAAYNRGVAEGLAIALRAVQSWRIEYPDIEGLGELLARPDAAEAIDYVLSVPVGGPSCGCGADHWACNFGARDE